MLLTIYWWNFDWLCDGLRGGGIFWRENLDFENFWIKNQILDVFSWSFGGKTENTDAKMTQNPTITTNHPHNLKFNPTNHNHKSIKKSFIHNLVPFNLNIIIKSTRIYRYLLNNKFSLTKKNHDADVIKNIFMYI